MKRILWGVIILTLILLFVTSLKNNSAVIIYSCMEQFRNEELQKQLNEKFPDAGIFVMYMPTAKAAAKIDVEGNKNDADIVVALDNAYMQKIAYRMENCSSFSYLKYRTDSKSQDNRFLTWERQSGAIIINKNIIAKYDLPIPYSYQDLLNPIYRDLIAMPDPKTSGTGFFFLKSLVNELGEDQAFKYMDALAENIKIFTESGSGPVKLLKQGEVAIGLGLTFQGVNEMNEGNDFIIIEPEYGYPYSFTSIGLIKKHDRNPIIKDVFSFLVNDFMIYDKEMFSPEKVLEEQKIMVENYPQKMNYADMSGIDNLEEKNRLLSKWKY